jgi:ribosomal protein S18 acetylase RimI-like enzyme
MNVRSLRQRDFRDVLKLFDEEYDEREEDPNYGDILRIKRPTAAAGRRWTKNVSEDIKNGHIQFTVADDGKKVVGFCIIRKSAVPDTESSHVGLLSVNVKKGLRGKGIGTLLMRRALSRARSKFEIVELHVLATNTKAIRLYKRMGFRQWGRAPGFAKRGKRRMDVIYMQKKL